MAHDKGSFSYKVINKKIRDILDARSELDNTAQIAMPFIKATTTISVDGGTGFTLGLHAFNEDVKYENIYSESEDSSMPLIGYTYLKDGTNKRIYADDPTGLITSRAYDLRTSLFTNTNVTRIPPPGITNATIGRNKNGVLVYAQLEIVVPSLIQLEALNRKFLVPGVGMILEWGQQFAPELAASTGELSNISDTLFPWHDSAKLNKILKERLALSKVGMEEILEEYVYPAQGQYMWMFGRIGNFSTKTNSDGSYNCTVKIVGPSEDSWAYATKNTVTPAKSDTSIRFCADKTNSVYSYFTNTVTGGNNFKTLLDRTKDNKNNEWHSHVQYFAHGNKKSGEPTETDKQPNISQQANGASEEAYFISWRFFVNVVLNDPNFGVKSIFKSAVQANEMGKLGMLLPYANGEKENRTDAAIATIPYINDEFESYVGMNKFLRSIDPGTMIIVNETAAKEAEKNSQYNLPSSKQNLYSKNTQTKLFYDGDPKGAKTLFDQSTSEDRSADAKTDRGFLSAGVWLNHNAVIECMMAGPTILRGITNLLERMNAATRNYWSLTLDVAHPEKGSDNSYNYMVVDANFRESSDKAVANFINDVHAFNKYTRITDTGKLVGSELLECSVDLSLPKLMFSQIATGGLVQASDIENYKKFETGLDELDATGLTDTERRLKNLESAAGQGSSTPPSTTGAKTPKISDPSDPLREMFAFLSLSGQKNSDGTTTQGPDLTILPKDKIKELLTASGICGQANVQTTGQTGGSGIQVGQVSIADSLPPDPKDTDYEKIEREASKYISQNSSICNKCIPPTSVTRGTYGSRPGRDIVGGNAAPKTRAEVRADVDAYIAEFANLTKPSEHPNEFIITENEIFGQTGYARIGRHVAPNSGHYTNQAIDIPVHTPDNATKVENFWRSRTGYQVINELGNGHIHIEWNADVESVPVPVGPTGASTTPQPAQLTDDEKKKCEECNKQQQLLEQARSKITETETQIEAKIRQFPGLNSLFRYVEVFPDYMVAAITNEANGINANAFGASPAPLSISADLTMPGIAGLRVGELFWIDKIPAFYKAFGAFQIMSIEDTVGIDGWTTKIHATFNYLGKTWKEAMYKKLNENR
jgi:hypothetical protein